jgi:CBS domain-containing protein
MCGDIRERKGPIAMGTTVRDVMTTAVVAVDQDTPYREIVTALREGHVRAVPVLDGASRVIGVVSEGDLLFRETEPDLPDGLIRLAWTLHEESKGAGRTAATLMTSPAVTISPNAPVADAARLMQSHCVTRLPVVEVGGGLVGIVSRGDVLSVSGRPDRQIHDVVVMVLSEDFGLGPEAFEVTVQGRVVTIAGQVGDRAVADRLLRAVRHVHGVVAVRDRLSYPAAAKMPAAGGDAADPDGHRLRGPLRPARKRTQLSLAGTRLG